MMSRYRLQGFVLPLFLIFNSLTLMARSVIRVDESKTRLVTSGNKSVLKLVLGTDSAKDVPVHIELEVLNTSDGIIESVAHDSIVNQKTKQIDVPLKESFSRDESVSNPLWRRVRYRVTAAGEGPAEARGVISVSELGSEPFLLRVAPPARVADGKRTRIHVFTQHPSSGRPVANVEIDGTLTISSDDAEHVLKASGRSNSAGYVPLDFNIPGNLQDPDFKFKVAARLGAFVKEVEDEIRYDDRTQILLSTDKPIYQPGQHLRIRVLAFDVSKRALDKAPVEVVIRDGEFTPVYRTELTTSRFGEADTDWAIPESVRLGDYTIQASHSDRSGETSKRVKISRYDLPAFTISQKSERPYYLPNQNARVEIHAEYLFGQPVKQGHVRVVRENQRQWNYRKQQWETDQAPVVEGDLDSQGRFLANIDLQEEHHRLASDDYQRYQDLQFAAYVTDSSTSKTEERRFELRLTKEPIHVYVAQADSTQGLPLEFYVSTFYADGTPAQSRVNIYEAPDRSGTHLVRVISTNRFGVAKVTDLRSDVDELLFMADDAKGNHGEHAESVRQSDSVMRIQMKKSIYRAGEPLTVDVQSSFSTGPVVLEVIREEKVLHSEIVHLNNGKAFTVILYREDFKDDVSIVAHYVGSRDNDRTFGIRTVAYPRDRELKIDAHTSRSIYAPGDEASVAFRIRSAEGLPQPSVLGVVVLDKAVEERARTEREFSGPHWFCDECERWLGFDREVSGLTRRDLDRLDLSQPVPDDIELAAEVLLNSGAYAPPLGEFVDEDDIDLRAAFKNWIDEEIYPLEHALNDRFSDNGAHPTDAASLTSLLSLAGLKLEAFHDPWGNPYRPSFSIGHAEDVMELQSAGPDKRFGSPDDFTALRLTWRYFQRYGEMINKALRAHYERTGQFIRDAATLRSELLTSGEDSDAWRDRWGRPYRFEFGVFRTQFNVTVHSSGPNRSFESRDASHSDDFSVWFSTFNYTESIRNRLDRVVGAFYREKKAFPETVEQFNEAVGQDRDGAATLTDPWMHPYYPTFKTEYYYSDRVQITAYREYLRQSSQVTSLLPVTSKIQFLVLRSAGPDGIEGTSDDFDVTSTSRILAQQSAEDVAPQVQNDAPILMGSSGAIRGVVTDASGAVIPGVRVVAKSSVSTIEGISNDSGAYLLRNLPAGLYEVSFDLPGFMRRVIRDVPVRSSTATDVSVSLSVGSVAQTVEVSVESVVSLATGASSMVSVAARELGLGATQGQSMVTPRLRDYFPETLLWQPALETDGAGRAQAKFKLADTLTTWKVAAVVSTVDGRVGVIEKELVSFQPFFVEHDPPKFLTQGDEIDLPVVIRSYLNKDQPVELAMKTDDAFAALNGSMKNLTVRASDTVRETFAFRAVTPVKDARQRITAKGSRASDSIEKPVTIRPDGQEINHVSSEVFQGALTHVVNVPADAISNTLHAELKIYPNLLAHLADGIEGILQRPYGCAEQTISSAYPSLMLLRYYKQSGRESGALALKASRYLQRGIDRLWTYQLPDGGFSYWGRGSADIAVTAYAIRFLNDAREIVPVDDYSLKRAYSWLIKQQNQDGSWSVKNGYAAYGKAQTLSLTSLVARTVSLPNLRQAMRLVPGVDSRDAVAEALAFLSMETDNIDEPYTLASLSLAASNAGNVDLVNAAASRLVRAAHIEREAAFWNLQTNTPFYGWGFAGRVETTALAVQALKASKQADTLVNQGIVFLLRNKDRYGVWHSSQATVTVFDALMSVGKGEPNSTGGSANVVVNGRVVASVAMPASDQLADGITLDLSQFLSAGMNDVQIHTDATARTTAQFVDTYYIPWNASAGTDFKRDSGSDSALRMSVQFSKTEASISDEIVCHVEAERIGFRGYGMMLAEIGLPPGADVDRASLEKAIESGTWDLYRYDVLPDRLIAYVWPRAGGTRLDFKFHLRYGINAKTPPSILYDYYNPDAQVTVKPVRFRAK